MARKLKIAAVFVSVSASLLSIWIYLTWEKMITGDQLKGLVLESDRRTYSSWYLYHEDQLEYCLSYSRPVVPIRYCVPKRDLEIRNFHGGDNEGNRYVAMGEFMLKKDRSPGLPEETF